MTAAPRIISFPKKEIVRRKEQELAFLPAALEIVETPPSPIGRAIALLIMLFFCLALAWTSLGTVDIVASAPARPCQSARAARKARPCCTSAPSPIASASVS